MAARKPAAAAKAPTGAVKPTAVTTEAVASEVLTMVSVHVKKPHTRRWRAGLCFTAEPRVESVTDEVLTRLQADPLLVVEEVSIPPSQPYPIEGEGVNAPSQPSPIQGEGANSPSPSRGGVGEGADSGDGVNPDESANTPAPATEG